MRPCRPLLTLFSCSSDLDWQPDPVTKSITGSCWSPLPRGGLDRYAVIVLPSASLTVNCSNGMRNSTASFGPDGACPTINQLQTRRIMCIPLTTEHQDRKS